MNKDAILRAWFEVEDLWFDWRHGVDTRGVVPPRPVAGPHEDAARHATSYQAVWTRNLRVLVNEARRWTTAELFVDIGAGKGKACIYAAKRFDRVIGVEYAADILTIAKDNQRRAGYENIVFVQADAALYTLPDEASLIFLFNPFDSFTLARFLTLNGVRLRTNHSVVAYANDRERNTLAQHGFNCVYRDPQRCLSLWR